MVVSFAFFAVLAVLDHEGVKARPSNLLKRPQSCANFSFGAAMSTYLDLEAIFLDIEDGIGTASDLLSPLSCPADNPYFVCVYVQVVNCHAR